MYCSQCGTELSEIERRCPTCSAPIRSGGILRRFWHWLTSPSVSVTLRTTAAIEKQKFVYVDKTSGKRQVFHSLDEIPPEIRAMLKEVQASGTAIEKSVYSFQGPDGQKHTYHSLEEMPPEIRATYESILKQQGLLGN
jgi:hypothetical protein